MTVYTNRKMHTNHTMYKQPPEELLGAINTLLYLYTTPACTNPHHSHHTHLIRLLSMVLRTNPLFVRKKIKKKEKNHEIKALPNEK